MALILHPFDIRFTHNSIKDRFGPEDPRWLSDTIEDLLEHRVYVDDFPMIRVYKFKGRYYSLDNRRLYIFKKLAEYGVLHQLAVIYIGNKRVRPALYTSKNGGARVHVRESPREIHHATISSVWDTEIMIY